ncbi:hypothetical protein I6A84_11960 [Frankia sp. CNm7]|uniref:Uncharacterized protein n=1 Tax=Frankia nepalensis TaxID=1836974 RepID=A0A937RJN0_9ACTN|nr:hypothetical protein [Frankia nepalensis]MBL7500111.1 hypothetical protein [Frankia nepalensis]MBL7512432.1 hypothetical protein [Frankia nepalensis]MBL7518806.1 hypothetical protein [Frankia nepalensis]MBL7628569.1 hypothetical protein [Frankia nepalensis]
MSWTIDETRVRPFLSAADRRDLLTLLRRPGGTGQEPLGDAVATPAPGRAGLAGTGLATPRPATADPVAQAPKWKDLKDGKDFKDHKDNKDNKDWKDLKDWKDRKDSKDFKDTKDSKDFKDFKDGIDGAHPGAAAGRAPDDRPAAGLAPAGPGDAATAGMVTGDEPTRPGVIDEDDIGAVLRASRVNRYLRAAGVVI